jgi:hypothetical protein
MIFVLELCQQNGFGFNPNFYQKCALKGVLISSLRICEHNHASYLIEKGQIYISA